MPDAMARRIRRFIPWFGALFVCLGVILSSPVHAQAPAEEPTPAEAPPLVGRVLVSGNVFTDSARIVRTFEVPTGVRFSRDMVRRGVKKLVALGLFSDVQVLNSKVVDGKTDLTIVVKERPRIASIKYSGNKKREDVDLEKKTFLKAGETYSALATQTQVDSLLQYYREEGFPRTKITPRLDTLATTNQIDLTFVVEEGEKFRITVIQFKGATAFPPVRLRKVMKSKQKGFFGGGDLKDETFAEDREKLEGWYHDHGYRDMRVDDFQLTPGATPQAMTLVVSLTEGPLYYFGGATFTGNKEVATPLMTKAWAGKPGARYDHSRIERSLSGMYAEYAERGYLYAQIEPRETVRDSAVDLEFAVTEVAPSHIRHITILGNKGTREHVIRRELDIHEGDLFRRSALQRSQGDMMRLGLFEDVTPDFTAAESTDVDLTFKVKEKQVGTASAGAGYTGQTGLTGFLELGHNNVLGNGQQLALHLERGANVENYSLSFTEPWFHDAPTLLGFSAYSQTSILTEYDQRRRGASGRIGRPLPWPDYSRGSIGYTLEKIRISNVRDSILLTGVTIGKDQLTSSLEGTFLRNSTDNPQYPTHGTRLTANEEYSGGPFLGDIHYHSHRYEGRAFLPSLFKHTTTMVRLRVGLVGQYTWKKEPIPDYVRFRLGGGNTLDPLRGYLDYQVVPPKFVTKVWSKFTRTGTAKNVLGQDSTYSVADSSLITRRYPGGRYMELFTMEQQFPIVHPLHGVLFFDAGNVWDLKREIQPFKLKMGAGMGLRMEIPILGNVGFDYGYGFNRDDGARWQGHFLLGNVSF